MGRTISVKELLSKNYPTYEFNDLWTDTIGKPEKNFRMLIWGLPKNGKTTFCIQFAKYLTAFGKVYYNSTEQGEGKSLQDVMRLCKADEVPGGKLMIGDRDTFDEMCEKLRKRNSPKFIFIDSLQYMYLTQSQYKQLVDEFPNKAFIIISWSESGGNPKGEHAKALRFMVDITCEVKKGVANVQSRFGPTIPYQIFDTPKPLPVGKTIPLFGT
jgi:GTPase SAR1 family protein